MKQLTHTWQEAILNLAPQSETLRELHPDVLSIAYEQQWFKLFVPKAYGGPGKKLPEILRLEEDLAYVDGSTAWTVTLCSGAAWFAGFLDPALAEEIFANPKVCFAGSGAVGGTARKLPDGYLINGHWKYASGALHATIFTANCVLQNEDGVDFLDESGEPIIKSFILKRNEVEIQSGWSYFGLVATGSHAFDVKDILVPENRSFKINELQIADEGFDYPFLQLAETTLAVNSLGMARRFIDLVSDAFFNRSGFKRYNTSQIEFFKNELTTCTHTISTVKEHFYEAFDASWNQLITNGTIDESVLREVSRLSRSLAHQSRKVVDTLYPYAGLEAAKRETELNRVWRDLHTASQHALLTF
ncbi:acyl-CoA dehydrogenase [Nubsella zeaxanthinifaciens]|jgi:alkylation response protein AidB-like acyl-CoA dehydrogenase|uniref:acyl-CoA dehydrogenase n=1 Tax=Nubsella zeaxanthinifaciens TaxID=392412 RepID=UPI000DE53520|nr:acyl-CoA dehydrogenase [Nubsella zeaxanthinifaciens]